MKNIFNFILNNYNEKSFLFEDIMNVIELPIEIGFSSYCLLDYFSKLFNVFIH
jgi:hypothetical protein